MLYVDTSIIVKLYIKEKHARKVSNWLRNQNEAVPLTSFHELEFTNALYLKQFRSEITGDQIRYVLEKCEEHEKKGVYYRPLLNWIDVWNVAMDLAKKYSSHIGSRSLDILHVASALTIKSDRFLTLDIRQSKLASQAGFKIEKL